MVMQEIINKTEVLKNIYADATSEDKEIIKISDIKKQIWIMYSKPIILLMKV